jgi:hypothetical protein
MERNLADMNQALRRMGLALLDSGETMAGLSPPQEVEAELSRSARSMTRLGSALLAVADGQMELGDVGELSAELELAVAELWAACD